ncbi:TetR/AcrR family transcriptional regulator [Ferruginibacter sp. SUN106]|uniref:TetR/AcrR family transcriptional regulator n=1 Tax=Ferruginibacter sp. SUN106 TaxID=2978348 RepID=UPI003D361DB5
MTKAERTKQFIIEQAAPIFNEKGIAGTSIDDVLKATKLAKGCLYSHFENKEALSHAAVDYLMQTVCGKTSALVAAADTAKEKLFAVIDTYKTPLTPAVSGGCPVLNFGVESDDGCPVIKDKIKTAVQNSIRLITGIIKNGIANKEFSKDFNADEFALKMFTLLEGGILICRVTNSNVQMKTLIGTLKSEIESYAIK